MPRKNIILDLDQTLIYSEFTKDFKKSEKTKLFVHKKLDKDYITFERPYLQVFLDYIFKNYNVAVWTAANKSYAVAIINKFILIKPGRKLDFVFYSDHCDISKKQNRGLKGLSMLWEYFKIRGYNETNTFIVDDNNEVNRIQKKNCYHIPIFDYNKRGSENDIELLRLIHVLKELK